MEHGLCPGKLQAGILVLAEGAGDFCSNYLCKAYSLMLILNTHQRSPNAYKSYTDYTVIVMSACRVLGHGGDIEEVLTWD